MMQRLALAAEFPVPLQSCGSFYKQMRTEAGGAGAKHHVDTAIANVMFMVI